MTLSLIGFDSIGWTTKLFVLMDKMLHLHIYTFKLFIREFSEIFPLLVF